MSEGTSPPPAALDSVESLQYAVDYFSDAMFRADAENARLRLAIQHYLSGEGNEQTLRAALKAEGGEK